MILHHKCPNCGSDLAYDAESGKLACHSCRERFDIAKFGGQPQDRPQPSASDAVTWHCGSGRAAEFSAKRKTDFLIITLNGTGGLGIEGYVAKFYDDTAPGYEQPHGSAAILAVDIEERDVFLAGFGKARTHLDDGRLDRIREKITPLLSEGNFYGAFNKYLDLAQDYIRFRPEADPENPMYRTGVQAAVACGIAFIIVWIMVYRSGGRRTVKARDYLDAGRSGVVGRYDHFVRQTVSRTRIATPPPEESGSSGRHGPSHGGGRGGGFGGSSGGGFGGGGFGGGGFGGSSGKRSGGGSGGRTTPGGRPYSGSKGKF